MDTPIPFKTSLDLEAGRLMTVIRSDLFLIASGHRTTVMNHLVSQNLRRLADALDKGAEVDPYLYFRSDYR